ncbi:uncharacterized protein LOC123484355 isoform X4 [Coregonus clupeaformis]|uniref:uncharacterized protein LOC123484355 isoform X4 n=1 Tax=Coregonus clupeaformis TaxID=59861 RepID=UPI001E1C8B67|nr:uncharacterized protein LOC123484355 isoform X4 [Coregonus clupeaformis]
MAQLSQKGGLCNMKMLLLAVIFCLLSFVAANVLVSSEHKTLMPVKDHPILNNPDATKETNFKSLLEQLASLRVKDDSSPEHKPLMPVKDHSVQNNPDATKETNFKSLLEQLASLRVKDDSSPGNVGQLTKGYSSKNVIDHPDFDESLPLNYVPEHKPLMPVKDHSVQNNPDATKETNFKSLLEQLASLRVKDDSSPEHKPLMPVKDHSVQNNPDATKETNFKSLLEQLASLRVKDDSSPGNVGQLTKGYSSKNVIDHPDFDESLPLNYVPEHKPLMPVKDHSVQNNPDATKETNFKSLLEQLASLRVKDDSSPGNVGLLTKGYSSKNVIDHPDFDESLPLNYVPEHKPLMPVKDHSVQNNPDATKETNFKSLLKSTLKIKPRVNILTDPSYSEPLVKVNLILGPVFYSFIVIVVLYEAVRISKEARRRSDAIATAWLTEVCVN